MLSTILIIILILLLVGALPAWPVRQARLRSGLFCLDSQADVRTRSQSVSSNMRCLIAPLAKEKFQAQVYLV
jgi:Protein of unknown function (DUF3309)